MMRLKNKLLLFSIFSIFILISLSTAAEFISEETVTIAKDQTIEDDVYLFGGYVTIEGTVDGDVYAFAGTIIQNGNVSGSLFAFGGTVIVESPVKDNLKAAGGNVRIGSDVIGDSFLAGGTLEINGKTGRDLIVGGGKIVINGDVGRDLRGGGEEFRLNGKVGRDVSLECDSLTLSSSADIGGNLKYKSQKEVVIQEGAVVHGKIIPTIVEKPAKPKKGIGGTILGKLLGLTWLLILGALLIYFVPDVSSNITNTILTSPLKTGIVGFIALFIIPITSFILMITIVGIPVALIVLALYIITLYISKIYVGLLIGNETLKRLYKEKTPSQYWGLLLGLFILLFVTWIPYLGGIISFFAIIFGLGAILITNYSLYMEFRGRKSS